MKKNPLILLMAVIHFIVTACTSDTLEQEITMQEPDKTNECIFVIPDFIPAHVEKSRTSFSMNDNGVASNWLPGDTIGILPDKGAQVYFIIENINGNKTNQASFDGGAWGLKANNNYAAYYPFIGDIYLDRSQVPVDYTGQVHKGKVIANEAITHLVAYDYMAAQAVGQEEGSLNFLFKHLSALVEVKFTVPTAGQVKQFQLKAEDKVIPITGTFDLSQNPVTIVSSAKDKTDALSIQIEDLSTTTDNEEVSIFFMLPPMEINTNTLTANVVFGDNQSFALKIKTESTLVAGKYYTLETETSTDTYPESLLLPDNVSSFSSNIANALTQLGGTKLKFVAKSSMTSDMVVHTDENGVKAYAVRNGDWLEIHTYAQEFKAGKKISRMFYSDKMTITKFSILKEIDLGMFNTEDATDMSQMFSGCTLLTAINLSSLNTTSVVNMRDMFNGCSSLKTIDFGESLNTSSVTDMGQMFCGCSSLTSIDLSKFNTEKVMTMGGMFQNCSSLKSITFSENFKTSSVTNMRYMFANCSTLTELDLSHFDVQNVINMEEMFGQCTNLKSITFGVNFKTSSVTNMRYMFYTCSSLLSLDLSSFQPTNVITMESMFSKCSSLKSIKLSSFYTSSVTNMEFMFYKCSSLTELDLSSLQTTNVTNMGNMFSDCSSLKSINLSSLNTSSVADMSNMFNSCSSLTELNLSNFDTSNVISMKYMFSFCESLTSLDLSNFIFNKNADSFGIFKALGQKSTNKPISIYVTADAKTYLDEKDTYIDSNYATLVVKGN